MPKGELCEEKCATCNQRLRLNYTIEQGLKRLAETALRLRELQLERTEKTDTHFRPPGEFIELSADSPPEAFKAEWFSKRRTWRAYEDVLNRYDACRKEHCDLMVSLREAFETFLEPHKVPF